MTRVLLDGLMVGALLVMAFAACANIARKAEADVSHLVPCFGVAGESVTVTGEHYFLILDQCSGAMKWSRTPKPPEANV